MSRFRDGIINLKYATYLLRKEGVPQQGSKKPITANQRMVLDFFLLSEVAESTDVTLVYFSPTTPLRDAVACLQSREGFMWSHSGELHTYVADKTGYFLVYTVTGAEGKVVHQETDTKAEFVRIFDEVESSSMLDD